MSVSTTVSEALDRVQENAKQVVKDLGVVLNEDSWGHEDLSKDHREALWEFRNALQNHRNNLFG